LTSEINYESDTNVNLVKAKKKMETLLYTPVDTTRHQSGSQACTVLGIL